MIPKQIWQTWKSLKLPEELESYVNGWKTLNKDYKHTISTDIVCRQLVLQHFGQSVVELYDSLPQSIMRADFWRILVLYINGGIYCDLDLEAKKPIEDIININCDLIVVKDLDNIVNFFIAATPKHPVLKICIDYMLEEANSILALDTQSFGMHSLHRAFREYYKVIGTNYPNNNEVQTLDVKHLEQKNVLIHHAISGNPSTYDYTSWRDSNNLMLKNRSLSKDILFFTTFNKSGFDLYGQSWIKSFTQISNYYPSIKAKIYYEGPSLPNIRHPNLEWVNFNTAIPHHKTWKADFLIKSKHEEYVKTMTVKFSHKSFVIQHVLDTCKNNYLIWLDGDCIFLPSDYTNFPTNILNNKFLACQVEENWDLDHIESGILIFDTTNENTKKFNEIFKNNYVPQTLVIMGQPYDGFVISKTLINLNAEYVNLNSNYGLGGIQSDPSRTFQNPELKSKFIHNIGWTGKNKYESWERVFNNDPVYTTIKKFLFGGSESKKEKLTNHVEKLKNLREKRDLFIKQNG